MMHQVQQKTAKHTKAALLKMTSPQDTVSKYSEFSHFKSRVIFQDKISCCLNYRLFTTLIKRQVIQAVGFNFLIFLSKIILNLSLIYCFRATIIKVFLQ